MIISPDGSEGAVKINQDARVYASVLDQGQEVSHQLESGRHAWLQVAAGSLKLNDIELKQGDGAAVSDETNLQIAAEDQAEILLFDLA